MMHLYPANAADGLEFGKIQQLLLNYCRTDAARERVQRLKPMTRFEAIDRALKQTEEYKNSLGQDAFPAHFTRNISKELRLLEIENAVLPGDALLAMASLADNMRDVLRWFAGRPGFYPTLRELIADLKFEKEIVDIVSAAIDEGGHVRDTASRELMNIRADLQSRRNELRKLFDTILRKLSKQGYLADISEGFLNGRRTLAINAENKRQVKGILHGESDTSRTVFIEPEETIELNNEIFSLERAESREIQRILQETTAKLRVYAPTLHHYFKLSGIFDFIRCKALLAQELDAYMPRLSNHPGIALVKARHPLLYLHNKAAGKPVEPLNLMLDRKERILIISGPNAGGKTVSMKTVGLLQIMAQSGLLISADPNSEVGLFKNLFIHIGDTQSIENELSTYSAHLRDMKYFMDFANGKTLFFIDELGSGSDPALGGAFAEAIVEDLAARHAIGIITTHYLNLKVMAGKVPGIVNGAMLFDEEALEPRYRLMLGKPGSSYTFAIALRSGLPEKVIGRARQLTERGHHKLDKLLHETEQQGLRLGEKEKTLDEKIDAAERARIYYEEIADKEKQRVHFETLKLQNRIKKEELDYLRETERKFKQIVQDWKKAENKGEVIDAAEKLLFRKKAVIANQSAAKKIDKAYETVGGTPQIGDLVRNKTTHQVGTLTEIRGDKRGIVKVAKMPFNVELSELMVVRKRTEKEGNTAGR